VGAGGGAELHLAPRLTGEPAAPGESSRGLDRREGRVQPVDGYQCTGVGAVTDEPLQLHAGTYGRTGLEADAAGAGFGLVLSDHPEVFEISEVGCHRSTSSLF
jgi:hypothetical protein